MTRSLLKIAVNAMNVFQCSFCSAHGATRKHEDLFRLCMISYVCVFSLNGLFLYIVSVKSLIGSWTLFFLCSFD